MKQLQDFSGSIAVVVSSCDAFFDAWRPFSFFFRKFWPDCSFPVYLIVNELRFRSKFIRPSAVGEARGWASTRTPALQRIQEPRVLYFQEDYFLDALVRREQLAEDFSYAF